MTVGGCIYETKPITPKQIPQHDNVNSPSHYKRGGLECIDVIRAELGEGFTDYCYGNAIKYLWRWKDKNGVEDLKKCRKYLNWIIEEVEHGSNKKAEA